MSGKFAEIAAAKKAPIYTGDINEYLEDLGTPKEPFEPIERTDPPEENFSLENSGTGPASDGAYAGGGDYEFHAPNQEHIRHSTTTSKFLIKQIDRLLGLAFAWYAMSENVEQYCSTPDEINELSEAWAYYLVSVNGEIPPWMNAGLTTVVIMGARFNRANTDRQKNLPFKKMQKELAELTSEKQTLDLKKQVEDLKKQLGKDNDKAEKAA